MSKLQYEKNKVIKTLKSEIYGINQLIDILAKIEQFNFAKFNGKIINIKLERELREFTNEYISIKHDYFSYNMNILIKDRYNIETKSYVGFYDSYTIKIETITTLNKSGKEQVRFNINTINNIKEAVDNLTKKLLELETELANIDNIINEIIKLDTIVLEFKKNKSSFLLESFKSINNYY